MPVQISDFVIATLRANFQSAQYGALVSSPVISIILPTFNGSKYLEASVRSCQSQTFHDWELIIVDDASTDNTPELISQFQREDSRIRSVRHPRNRKLPAALNTGFSSAKGKYITWTSDDNCFYPQSLCKMLECLENNLGIDIVYTDFCLIDENSAVTTERICVKNPEFLTFQNVIGPSFLYRRVVQEVINGYDENLFLVEDYDFWLRASIHFRMLPLHEVLYLYRQHPSSLTIQRSYEIALAHEKALLRNIRKMLWLSPKSRVLGLIHASRLKRSRGQTMGANSVLMKAFCVAPFATLVTIVKMLVYGPDVIYQIPLNGHCADGH